MSQRVTARRRLPEGEDLDLVPLSLPSGACWLLPPLWRQGQAAFAAMLTMVVVGTINGWTMASIHQLIVSARDVPLTLRFNESSWIFLLTGMIGSLVAAQLADRRGRKYCLIVCSTMFTVGWFIIYVATYVPMIHIARVILGIGVGIAQTVNPMYVSEIADIKYRGILGTIIPGNFFVGILVTCSLVLWLTYNSLLCVHVIVSFISILLNMCLPETPYFLVAKGKRQQACKSIAYYKGIVDPHRVNTELRALLAQARYGLQPPSTYELQEQSRSDFHTQSEPSMHTEVTCEEHPQPTDELRPQHSCDTLEIPLQPSRELHSQSTSELHQPSTSQFHQPSTSQLHRPPTSEIHPAPTSEIHQPFTSQIPRPSTSQIPRPSTSAIHPEPTSKIQSEYAIEILHPQSTSELHRPSTSQLHRPSTSEIHPEATSEIHNPLISAVHPVTSAINPEPTSEMYRQSTSQIHPEATSEIHNPFTSAIHPEPTSEMYRQSTSQIHPEPTNEIHTPSKSQIHGPSTSQTFRPSSSEMHRPPTSKIYGRSIREILRSATYDIYRSDGPQSKSTREMNRPSARPIYRPPIIPIHPPSISQMHQSSTSTIHPEPTNEMHRQSTSQIHPEPTSKIHSESTIEILHPQSTSELHRPFTSQLQRPSTSEIHPEATSAIRPEPTSEMHRPSTSEIDPDPTSEIHSRSRSNLIRQSSVDLQGSTDINETYMDGCKYTCLTKLKLILQRSNRKALVIMLSLIVAQHLSGNFITAQHLQLNLTEAKIVNDLYEGMIAVQLVRLLSTCLTMFTADFVGRRKLLILSTLGSCFTLILRTTYLLLDELEIDVSIVYMLSVINLTMYQVMFQIGLGTLPTVLLCELFPTKLTGFVAAIIVIFDGIIGFIAWKLYLEILDNISLSTISAIFASSCCLAFIMVFISVPETKGKTYQQIEALLVDKNLHSLNEDVRSDEMDLHRT